MSDQERCTTAHEHGSDPCACGDYRSQHPGNGRCSICASSLAPYDGCTQFRFTRHATEAEMEHWKKYHLPKLKADHMGNEIVGHDSAPNSHNSDDYVAWLRYKHHPNGNTTIHICDSDAEGAFKVYRHSTPSSVAEQPVPSGKQDEREREIRGWMGSRGQFDAGDEDHYPDLPEIPCCPIHEQMLREGRLPEPLDNCIVCIRNERNELRKRVQELEGALDRQTPLESLERTRVQQKQSCGCTIAVVATVLGKSYEEVAAYSTRNYDDNGGVQLADWDEYLAFHGYLGLTVYRVTHLQGVNKRREVWPPKPFAPIHLCSVVTDAGAHAIVMLFDGRILDPCTESRTSLADYKDVSYVKGLWHVAEAESLLSKEQK